MSIENMQFVAEKRFEDQKRDFLNIFSEIIKSAKLNEELILKVEKKCQIPVGFNNLLFPSGINEILDEYMKMQDKKMLYNLLLIEKQIKIRDIIGSALKIRIKQLTPKTVYILSHLILPQNLSLAYKFAFRTCDLIWKYAGDTSTDFNFYTKRGLLVTVYINSILFYISDESVNYIETDKFIEYAIETSIKLGKVKDLIKLENIPLIRLFV